MNIADNIPGNLFSPLGQESDLCPWLGRWKRKGYTRLYRVFETDRGQVLGGEIPS